MKSKHFNMIIYENEYFYFIKSIKIEHLKCLTFVNNKTIGT